MAENLGLALEVIFRRGCYLDYPLASIKAWLFPAAQLRQLHVFVGEDRSLLGYMTWAFFTEETEARWKKGAIEMLHLSEWNEGDRLWILDFKVWLISFMHYDLGFFDHESNRRCDRNTPRVIGGKGGNVIQI